MKTPDELGGTDEQQAEYAAKKTRVIKARALTDTSPKVSYLGRLVSHRGAPTPERLESAYSLTTNVVLVFRREHDGHRYWVEDAVSKDAEITIHPEA